MKNYYIVLGLPRTATPTGIRSAYRALAKRYHPDVASETEADSFRQIAEAYQVLSDPERRDAHDRELDAEKPRLLRRVPTVVEPLIPEPESRPEPLRARRVHASGLLRCPHCRGTGLVLD